MNSITLNGSASSDPKGPIKGYEWTKITGTWQYNITSPKSAVTTVTGLAQGIYEFRLTVYDNNWTAHADTVRIAVGSGAVNPTGIANAGPDIAITLPTNTCSLNGSASADPAGQIRAYRWRAISGPNAPVLNNATTAIAQLSSLTEGVYAFELTVWGNNWTPVADTVLVVVSSVNGAGAAKAQTFGAAEAQPVISTETYVADKLQVYPNPAKDAVNLQISSKQNGNSLLSVFDISGRLVRRITFTKSQPVQLQNLTVADLQPGIYNIDVSIDNKTRLQSRLLKQ